MLVIANLVDVGRYPAVEVFKVIIEVNFDPLDLVPGQQ